MARITAKPTMVVLENDAFVPRHIESALEAAAQQLNVDVVLQTNAEYRVDEAMELLKKARALFIPSTIVHFSEYINYGRRLGQSKKLRAVILFDPLYKFGESHGNILTMLANKVMRMVLETLIANPTIKLYVMTRTYAIDGDTPHDVYNIGHLTGITYTDFQYAPEFHMVPFNEFKL